MQDFYIVDTTLRDGEQTPGVVFTKDEKLQLAAKLDELGVDIIEAGIPAMGPEEMETINEMLGLHLKAEILAWNRMHMGDIEKSLACGVTHIHIAAPVSDLHIYKKLKKDREWILTNIEKTVAYAVEKGCKVSVGGEDASRADIKFLMQFYQTALKAGAARIRYADTVGILSPMSSFKYIREIKEHIGAEIDFHGHNDFGMATANALSAFKAGARYISCSVNGLGERAGNTPMEEIVMALKCIEKCSIHLQPNMFQEISEWVQRISGKKLSDSKPIVGKDVFSHESGIHVDGLLKDAATYEAFSPEEVGRRHSFIIGKSSGTKALIYQYSQYGISINEEQAEEILKSVRSHFHHDKKIEIDAFIRRYIQA